MSTQSQGLRIRPDNTGAGRAPMEALVASGETFAVRVSSAVLAVDLDLSGDLDVDAVRLSGYRSLVDALRDAGVPVVEVSSGRGHHRHLFARLGHAAHGSRWLLARYARGHRLDVRVDIRPPGTPHRHGLAVTAVDTTWTQALAHLTGPDPDPAQVATALTRLGLRDLTWRTWELLRRGPGPRQYRSSSEARMAVAVAVRGAGLDAATLHDLLADPTHAVGASFRAKTHRWQRREVRRLVAKADAFIARNGGAAVTCPEDGRGQVLDWAAALDRAPWRGMAGGTDLAVARAMAGLAYTLGGPVFGAALAAIAVAAGVSRSTARRSLRRLIAIGWVHPEQVFTATTCAVHRLRVPAEYRRAAPDTGHSQALPSLDGSTGRSLDPEGRLDDLGGDHARWRTALGKTKARYLSVAGTDPVTPHAFAARMGTTVGNARVHLSALADRGYLLRHSDGRYSRPSTTTAHGIAAVAGTSGARDRAADHLVIQRAARAQLRRHWAATFERLADGLHAGEIDAIDAAIAVFGAGRTAAIIERLQRTGHRRPCPLIRAATRHRPGDAR